MRPYISVELVPLALLFHRAWCLPIAVAPSPVAGDVPVNTADPFGQAHRAYHCGPTVVQWRAWIWNLMFLVTVGLVLLTGLLAGLTLAVLSVDLPRLTVWTRTGSSKRRFVWLYGLCLEEADYQMPESTRN